ncbi:MAG: cisplatin damage response ATP-dependent DNA ligase, partial [Alphaproteobacteria bacterium]
MKAFAGLLDGLAFQPSRNGKLRLLEHYFAATPDPDRGFALAALTGGLSLRTAKPKLIRELAHERVDPVLFGWSYDFVGDLAETVALIWPGHDSPLEDQDTTLGQVITRLNDAGRSEVPALIMGWLDQMDATQRWALLKLVTGGLRVGVSAG